jgi:hypothetical protein
MKKPCLLLLALAACGSGANNDTTLHIANYDTACTSAADCAVVFVGDPCVTPCKCPNAAINSTATLREASDLAAAEALCTGMQGVCNAACASPLVTCTQGACALQ